MQNPNNQDYHVGAALALARQQERERANAAQAQQNAAPAQQLVIDMNNLNINDQAPAQTQYAGDNHYNNYMRIWNMTGGPQAAQQAQRDTQEHMQIREGITDDEMVVAPVNHVAFGRGMI